MLRPLIALGGAGSRSLPVAMPRPVLIAGLVGLTALAAQIRVPLPFTPVPLTGQVFAVLLAGYLGGPLCGLLSQAAYVACGALGLPVFSGLVGGLPVLLGPTGGYLLAYPAVAWMAGFSSLRARRPAGRVIGGIAALVVLHATGALWISLLFPALPARQVLSWSLTPFIAFDLAKLVLAERLSRRPAFNSRDGRAPS